MNEPSPEESPPPISYKEQISNWIETGGGEEAIAVYGTSIENFLKILQRGSIPPFGLDDPNVPNGSTSDENIYYFLPMFQNLQKKHPELVQKMKDRLIVDNFSDEEATQTLDKDSLNYEFLYRRNNAFFEHTKGIIPEEKIDEVSDYLPTKEGELDQETESELLGILSEEMVDPEKKKIIMEAIHRRGITLYFNSGIFANTTTLDRYESEHEILISAKNPLPFSCISGIKVYTDEEKQELLQIP